MTAPPAPGPARLLHGLPPSLRAEAARLYWQAFGGKLGAVLGPEPRALAYLERAIRADHVIALVGADHELLGIAGFKTPEGSFSGGTTADLRAAYGRFGAAWRVWVLSLLAGEIDNDRFLIDGICVRAGQRGRGHGRRLLDALCQEARRRQYDYIRLDVIDSNWRARALYEREGFVAVKSDPIGLLRHVFGFASSTTMVKPLS
ncbi:MAG: GNAT family N-acetyltransferase [Paracoccaceae bacterium]